MVTLIILDGFGLSKQKFGNAIYSAGTPHLDKLKEKYPFASLQASGKFVGLPDKQMGNSEVGHLTLGAGRVVLQDLQKINADIKDKSFFKNKQLLKAINHAKNNSSALHLMGLLSDGGVHSHINHLFAIIDLAKEMKLESVYIHAFLDGRDTPYNSSLTYLNQLEKKLAGTNYKIASISGRIYAMDREQRYDRLEKTYRTIIFGENHRNEHFADIINASYKQDIYDEFILPTLLDKNGTIKDNDSIIFFNYRSDRAIELTNAIINKKFNKFERKPLKNLLFSPMELYSEDFKHLNVLYPPEKIDNNLSAILSQNNLKQFHIAETTKYAHVTFFFNGGIEKAYKGEDRKLIESIDTKDYSYYPKMKAVEITEESLDAIASAKYDFILVNFSNPDMIGHTGNYESTKQAITCIDKCAYSLALASILAGGECIITADHGNAENMIDEKGNKITTHTNNPVPLYFVSEKHKKAKLKKNMSIANIAPTILKLLNIEIPRNMEKPLF
ncbi:MAG: 2,3-bisphosphoglycerate-independent phosphoglycerate mutase [Clostridiales bacterium]|nr:2,3-bisphosphoglycerate-independent phosphoglycerate mutase [Clostridiales bacterium]